MLQDQTLDIETKTKFFPPDRNSGLSTGLVSRLLTSLELTARIGGGLGLEFTN